jgi:excisionase family DNA binding protein
MFQDTTVLENAVINDAQKLAYTIEEAASIVGRTRTALYDAICKGEIDSYRDGKRRMVSRRALEVYVARKEAESVGRKAA